MPQNVVTILRAGFSLELRRLLGQRRSWIAVGLFLLPPALMALIGYEMGTQRYREPDEELIASLMFTLVMVMQAVIPLTTILHGSSTFRDELEDQTLTYLMIRPIPRYLLALVKWGANTAFLGLLAFLSTILSTIAFVSLAGGGVPTTPGIILACLAPISVGGHLGIYMLLGLLTRRSMVLGFLLAFILEVLAWVPAVVRKVTITHYVASIFLVASSEAAQVMEGVPIPIILLPSTVLESLLGLGAILAVGLGGAACLFTLREYQGGKKSEDAAGSD